MKRKLETKDCKIEKDNKEAKDDIAEIKKKKKIKVNSDDDETDNDNSESDSDNDTSDSDSDDEIDNLPLAPPVKDRVKGTMYRTKDGEIRYWNGKYLYCKHKRKNQDCRKCLGYWPYYCEECEHGFFSLSKYERHLRAEVHKLTPEELIETRNKRHKKSAEKCYDSENYIVQVVKNIPDIEEVENVGKTGSKFDILFKFKDEKDYRVLQVKTLVEDNKNRNISYYFKNGENYIDDTLIIGVNNELKFYCIVPYSIVKDRNPRFSHTNLSMYFYDDENIFKSVLLTKLKSTTSITKDEFVNSLPDNFKQQFKSLERLKNLCKQNELVYEDRTNSTLSDYYINNLSIQCKTTSRKVGENCTFMLAKSGLMSASKKLMIPYSDSDNIDIFVFNYVDEKYQNDYYIIPTRVLLERGFIESKDHKGKVGILLPFSRDKINHWTTEFLNNFNLFKDEKLRETIGKLPFEKKCIENKLEYKKGLDGNRKLTVLSVNNKKVQFIKCKSKMKNRIMKICPITKSEGDKKYRPYDIKDRIDVFILEFLEYPGKFCILPISKLIKKGIVGTDSQDGKCCFKIRSFNGKEKDWASKYWNNFTIFE